MRCKQKSRWQRITYAIPLPSWAVLMTIFRTALIIGLSVAIIWTFIGIGFGFMTVVYPSPMTAAVGGLYMAIGLMLIPLTRMMLSD